MIELLPFVAFAAIVVVPMLYWLVRRDGLAVEAVVVDEADFAAGCLPPVCCKTGDDAEVGATVKQQRWFKTAAQGIVPITTAQREAFHRNKRVNRRARLLVLAMLIVPIPLANTSVPEAVELGFVVTAFTVMAVATVSNLAAHRCLAEPRRGRDGSITLRGVHPRFVAAVQESRPSTRPATMADRP